MLHSPSNPVAHSGFRQSEEELEAGPRQVLYGGDRFTLAHSAAPHQRLLEANTIRQCPTMGFATLLSNRRNQCGLVDWVCR